MLLLNFFGENGGSWWLSKGKDKEDYALVIKQGILMILHLSNDRRHGCMPTAWKSDINTGQATDQIMLSGECSLNV